jgi:glycyl-tRNA synthetase alpha subunit
MFRQNIHYFNEIFTDNYHLSKYKMTSIIIYNVLNDINNQDIFRNEIKDIYESILQKNPIKLRVFLLDKFLEKYKDTLLTKDDKRLIKNILKPYFASYGYTYETYKELINNTDKLYAKIKEDPELSIYDIKIISLEYGLNFIIFTLQNEDMVNFLNINQEHNNNPKINMQQICMNKDTENSKYLILNHRFASVDKHIHNHFSHMTIDDNSLIEYRNLPIKLRGMLDK